MKTALVTGVSGQDGAYLTQLLLASNYRVFGAYRRTSSVNFWRLQELGIAEHPNLSLVEYDLTDLGSSISLINTAEPVEIYNLAAQSFVGVSFEQPTTTAQITGLGALNLLEAIRVVNKSIRFYQASTSEMFGKVQAIPQSESTPFYPRSPYGVAKLYAHWMTVNYRESYGIFGCSGILFNHESPLRGLEFVTRKITDSVAKIALGKLRHIELGNLDAKRDWGFAKEYVDGMYRMMQVDDPDTFVLATNRTETVRDFVLMSFRALGIEVAFSGVAESETAVVTAVDEARLSAAISIAADAAQLPGLRGEGSAPKPGQLVVRINPRFYRPAEVELLIGDASKARTKLGWSPQTGLEALSEMMVKADLRRNLAGVSF
jgi:GDPmannose 4,6-dehydratase